MGASQTTTTLREGNLKGEGREERSAPAPAKAQALRNTKKKKKKGRGKEKKVGSHLLRKGTEVLSARDT